MTAPTTDSAYRTYDEKIRAQAEMLTSLLSAGLQTQEAVDKAVLGLNKLEQEVQRQISAARKDLSTLADSTATQAAKLLTEKFVHANAAAEAAAARYERAGRLLGIKTFAVLFGSIAIACAIAWFLVSPFTPSHQELELRRAELARMEAKAAELEKKGVNLKWEDCQVENQKGTRLCLRTEGPDRPARGTNRYYAIPYSH